MLIYADDENIFRSIEGENDSLGFQKDLIKIEEWGADNFSKLGLSKCHVMKTVTLTQSAHTVNGKPFPIVSSERDLELFTTWSLNTSLSYMGDLVKANFTFQFMRKQFGVITSEFFLRPFKMYAWPYLEIHNEI